MSEIRFYTLKSAGGTARLRHACVLTEQAWLAGERVLVWLEDTRALEQFDTLLWTFGDRAFVPHEPLAGDPRASEAPVQLHSGVLDARVLEGGFTTVVMLRDAAAPELLRFAQVIEVIDADPAGRDAGRARFRFYREHGSTPQHFEVTSD